MEKHFQVKEEDKDELLSIIKSIKGFQRIITKVNRNQNGYLITIQGEETEVQKYMENLEGFTSLYL